MSEVQIRTRLWHKNGVEQAVTRKSVRKPLPALDSAALRELALAYVGRYATSRARLARYLGRKLQERGWDGEGEAPVTSLIARFAELGYVDDEAYARMKGAAMERRGLGVRRIRAALAADGIGEADRVGVEDKARRGSRDAAAILARRKRIGPYAAEPADPKMRERQIAAFLRAGHGLDTALLWVDAAPGDFPPEEGPEEGAEENWE